MFIKYPHVERLGSDEVEGMLVGTCHIFPKIDGTNASVWLDTGGLCAGSRRRELTAKDDNAGFCKWLLSSAKGVAIKTLLEQFPDWTLYGEWLVPHSLKTYRKDAWRKLYVFDVFDNATGLFVPYDTYIKELESVGRIDYIPILETCENPTEEHLQVLLLSNTYLIEDGKGSGEGIVIKRYGFVNQYGRTTWAKLVRNEFKEENKKVFGPSNIKMTGELEIKLAQEYATVGRIDKILAKMTENAPWNSRRIPELFSRTWNDIITGEMWNILKKHRNPNINFRRFHGAMVQAIKDTKPELF